MTNYRRFELYGGPGSSKSTTAARLYGDLSSEGYKIELVREEIKEWAYLGRKPVSHDQAYFFGRQLHAEDSVLQHVPFIVTDSPLLANATYAKMYGYEGWQELVGLAQKFEVDYPSVNIILDRTGIPYAEEGRYQSYKEAMEVDSHMVDMVERYAPKESIHTFFARDYEGIKDFVRSAIDEAKDG